jgi:hypothetical protein
MDVLPLQFQAAQPGRSVRPVEVRFRGLGERKVVRGVRGADRRLFAAVDAYETAMRDYANEALKLSTRNATNAALATPTNRTAFRTLLRAGTHVPALQRKMFGPTNR